MVSSLLTCESSNDGVWILYLKRMLCIALPATGILADEMGLGMYMIVATVRGTALFTTILFFEFNPSLLREEPAKCDHVRQVARSPFWVLDDRQDITNDFPSCLLARKSRRTR